MHVLKYDKLQWEKVAEQIHNIVFDEYRPSSLNRIDFALVAWKDVDPIGYVTCRETDSESIYISFGGVMPENRNSENSKAGMEVILSYLKEHYKRANMLVENTNIFMLKKALNIGFLPVGIANYRGSIFVDLRYEWGE